MLFAVQDMIPSSIMEETQPLRARVSFEGNYGGTVEGHRGGTAEELHVETTEQNEFPQKENFTNSTQSQGSLTILCQYQPKVILRIRQYFDFNSLLQIMKY